MSLERATAVMKKIEELALISEEKHCLKRTYGTEAFLRGRDRVAGWMKQAGLDTRVDAIGNVRGRLVSNQPGARTLVIASHIDTVVNAGKFDGPLGVLIGLDGLEQLIRTGQSLPFHIELIGFCDEEGTRFHTTYLGSKVVAGHFNPAVLQAKDAAGISLEKAINQIGGDVNQLSKDAIAQPDWLGYFEIHIEQGPVLYNRNIPVAVVSAIACQSRAEVIFKGEAGHAGTVPMDMRKDALAGAARFVSEVEALGKAHTGQLVATVGRLEIAHAASNVIPGEVKCSLDLRSADENLMLASYASIQAKAGEIARERNIEMTWRLIQQSRPTICDPGINGLLKEAIAEAGYEVLELVSGAGHDAVPISAVAPVAMLFVKCFRGISHHPLENVEPEDIAAAIRVSDNFIQRFIEKHSR